MSFPLFGAFPSHGRTLCCVLDVVGVSMLADIEYLVALSKFSAVGSSMCKGSVASPFCARFFAGNALLHLPLGLCGVPVCSVFNAFVLASR